MKKSWIIVIIILLIIFSYRFASAQFLYQGTAMIELGSVISGDFREEIVSYRNSSPTQASLNPVLKGQDAAFFSVSSNQCINVASSQSCNVTVRFQARTDMEVRTYVAQMGKEIISAQLVVPAVSGTPTPGQLNMFLLEPNSYVFQISQRTQSRFSQTFKITNRAGVVQTIDLALEGPESLYYSMSQSTCGSQLIPGSSCEVTVSLSRAPLNINQASNAHLSISGVKAGLAFKRVP